MMRVLTVWASCFTALLTHAGDARYLDNYVEAVRLFGVARDGQHSDSDLAQRLKSPYYFEVGHKIYSTPGFAYDFDDKRVGDFSVTYCPALAGNATAFGFMTSLWGHYAQLDDQWSLKFFLKTKCLADKQGSWKVLLLDAQGRSATAVLEGVDTRDEWKEMSVPLKDLKKADAFELNAIRLCEFHSPEFGADALVKIDFARFEKKDGTVVGISDKTLEQRLAEGKATRQTRITKAFEASAERAYYPVISAFALMYVNKDLARANQLLREDCAKMVKEDPWSLLTTPIYCRFYYWFSSRCGTFKGRLDPETEKLLLETLWERTRSKNDIHWARQSTWWLDGSENHDLNAKVCNLVTSRIFMNEPAYKDRAYPDYGFGGGYHYGHAGYYGKGVDPATRHGGGRANLADKKRYTAKDHYDAWLPFIKTYFRERARYGFFVENASSSYSKHTMNMVDLAYAYSGDDELHRLVGDFMTLYYAHIVQTYIAGIPGGPKTRHHGKVGGYDANTGLLGFHLGGPGDGGVWYYWNTINGYELPGVVQRMALDREGLGCFVHQSRGIGEADPNIPHPPGTERSLVLNPESRFLKYSYVTPGYTLSTQMDHPWALHSHLSKAGRWHGMTVAHDEQTRIVPVIFPTEPDYAGKTDPFALEGMYKTAQHRNTLIVQRSRSFSEVNPTWFPLYPRSSDQGIYIGKAWDQKVETSGWLFLRKGEVYGAIRVVLWDKAFEEEKAKQKTKGTQTFFHGPEDEATVKLAEKPYAYRDDEKFIVFNDRFSPMIIQAGDTRAFGSFEAFIEQVSKAPIALYKTVVPSFNILVFTPPGQEAQEMVFNAANNEMPTIGGKVIDYSHHKTFDSPYLQSPYKSGTITLQYGGETLILEFMK